MSSRKSGERILQVDIYLHTGVSANKWYQFNQMEFLITFTKPFETRILKGFHYTRMCTNIK